MLQISTGLPCVVVLCLNDHCLVPPLQNSIYFKLPLRYPIIQDGQVTLGKEFNVSYQLLQSIGLPWRQFMALNFQNAHNLTFTTGASSGHFGESTVAVGMVQSTLPGQRIVYYDLGLLPKQIMKVWNF